MENFITFKPISYMHLKSNLKKKNLIRDEDFNISHWRESNELPLKDVDGNLLWLDMSVAENPDNIYGFIRYGDNNVDNLIKSIEEISGQTIYSEHHRYYPYIFEGTFDDGFNSVNEMINLIEHDLVSDNPQFKEDY